ncbi:G2/M phase-specific E3 ubiquitin-protein ligase-like [Saccoglossus kowalevskii]|uniref:G2/M phase-specific E3 ubiquitin-protein ligase-like n=1 Tax=Saccoglossus kowalevskii TaxID=10224 RepID=A0ABM0GSQ8_SACKO|nr:PREDICTED: G2/M phase-specific E3 ubiquitin-protein ligase-like [Saccoglossus kowalevskii]
MNMLDFTYSGIFLNSTEDDRGGPMREMLTLTMNHIVGSHLLDGTSTTKFLTCISKSVDENEYYLVGQIIAMSLVHGGPAPHCFADHFFNVIVHGTESVKPTTEDLPVGSAVKEDLLKLRNVNVEEANSVISGTLENLLELTGIWKHIQSEDDKENVIRDTIKWYLFGRTKTAVDQFKNGLSTLGVLAAIQEYPFVFKPSFCYEAVPLTAATFAVSEKVVITRSENESNAYNVESRVLAHWADFLQDVEESESQLTLAQLLMFSTGCCEFVFGLQLGVQFRHEKEANEMHSKFPKANTCAGILSLPVVHNTYDEFKNAMEFGLANAKGFSYA